MSTRRQVLPVGRHPDARLSITDAHLGEGDRHALPGPRGPAVHEVGVDVRLARAAGAPAQPESLSSVLPITLTNRGRTTLQMGDEGDDVVVAADGPSPDHRRQDDDGSTDGQVPRESSAQGTF